MINLINRLKWFVGLVLLQVLILNKMHINGYLTALRKTMLTSASQKNQQSATGAQN